MPTAIEHINRALNLIGAASPVKPASPETLDTARQILNEMAYRWADDGIEVGLIVADEVGAGVQSYEWASAAINYSLALDLADALNMDAPPRVLARQEELYRELLRRTRLDAVMPGRVQPQERLPIGSGNTRGRRYARRFYPAPRQPSIPDVTQEPIVPPDPTPVIPRQQVVFPALSRIAALPQAVQNIANLIVQDVTLAPLANDQMTAPGAGVGLKYRICDASGTAYVYGDYIMYLDDTVTQQNFSGTLALWVEETA